ncbi:Fur family transcriptional regulator [Bacteroides reticulotermitis]|uniref:Zinc uptake regulation protein ZUR n=2 Tax=Bacteroides reticulotermitis TaxID=1133319 RepID=W4UZN4_9BACE|nr:transcriptional regulator [Bacteroides reticulotermitis]MBB4045459.1 Fur family ferric uptake transcriptional regulator [Bacteroides reticulotermitis]GAE86023.1 zinc uptake regulation protein ZUR [Bacteroides reticulotermitis JCM 10512]HJD75541.1 transcriptional repressor [Bacteroides reticulotermitis]
MKEEDVYLHKLGEREIKPTAMRLLILRTMSRFERAFSLLDLEIALDTVDKSTLSRTITLFLKHHLIHCIDDGSGSLKYSVCSSECNCDINDLHVHFYCTNCHKTYCLRNIHIPPVSLPQYFTLESINYVLKGLCDHCSPKRK